MRIGIDLDGVVFDSETTFRTYEEIYDIDRLKGNNLIDREERNSMIIDDEIGNILETNEGQNIKADIEILKSMGFDKKMINKVYIILRPESIDRAIDFMTQDEGVYHHNFI